MDWTLLLFISAFVVALTTASVLWVTREQAAVYKRCAVCRQVETMPGTHMCFGPLLCGDCGEEFILEDLLAGRINLWGHIPCPAREVIN